MHTLQTIISNLKPFDDFHLYLHELNILNLLTNISIKKQLNFKITDMHEKQGNEVAYYEKNNYTICFVFFKTTTSFCIYKFFTAQI